MSENKVINKVDEIDEKEKIIPKIIFIVPYRDRKYQMNIFRLIMKNILEDSETGSGLVELYTSFLIYS